MAMLTCVLVTVISNSKADDCMLSVSCDLLHNHQYIQTECLHSLHVDKLSPVDRQQSVTMLY